ncbi:phage tail tape measure protein [Actinophytocola oryzae]|uniref:Phage-related minor tail protein n=1 Tax=Actinophytocola oryzae TaxID=502181 RepID=A0A4R7UVQ9_9PSEU|nr:phage tail tape measure protein [Actinophytocola oryzae]TDV40117.1 phage-related minor tail protein [Actinophytocola oryzae]
MALLVGQLLADISADAAKYFATVKRVEAEHDRLTKKLGGEKPAIDADPKPFEKTSEKVAKSSKDTAKAIDSAFNAAWRSVVSDLQRVEKQAWESGDGISDAFTTSLAQARAELERLHREGKTTGAGLETELGDALRNIKADVRELGPAGREAGAEMGGGLRDGLSEALGMVGGGGPVGDLIGSLGGGGKAGFLGLGLAVGGALISGIQQRWAELKVGALIAAQTGAAASEAGRLGSLAGDMLASGVVDSLEDAGAAISAVVNVLIPADATEAAIGRIASKVSTLSTVMGEEFSRISRSAKTMLLNGLADNVGQALDMIGQANAQGLNIAGDLLDTMDEYSGQFARLGLEGPEALGLMSQALQGGARDMDFAADALKELAINTRDLSRPETLRGFEALGFNAEDMARKFGAGGDSAKQALRDVLNGLQAIKDPIVRNTAAVDLFGTKAEDLGTALFSMDLDDAASQFGEYAGSVEDAAQKLQQAIPFTEKLSRGFENMTSDVIESSEAFGKWTESWSGWDPMSGGLDAAQQKINEFNAAIDRWASTGDTKWLDELKKKYPEMAEAIGKYIEANKGVVNAQHDAEGASDDVTGAYAQQIETMDDLIDRQKTYSNTYVNSAEAQINYNQALADAAELSGKVADGLNDTKSGFDFTTEAGQKAQGAINDVVTSGWDMVAALSADHASTAQLNDVIAQSNTKLYELLVAMGVNSDAAKIMADRMFGIPDVDPSVTLVDNASPKIKEVTDKLNGLDGKWINTYVNTIFKQTGTAPPNSPAGGGGLLGSSAGGATGAIAEFYAQGGLRPLAPAASIIGSWSRTGVMRVIGDNARFDEAYIPLDRASSRSQAILDEAISRLRPEWLRGGNGSGGGSSTYVDRSDRSRSITVNAVQGVPTIQQLRDLQHEQEVLYSLT